MSNWCLKFDKDVSEPYGSGCTDEWGTQHSCPGCPHNKYMGDCSAIAAEDNDGLDILH